jgi:hypothetical protein
MHPAEADIDIVHKPDAHVRLHGLSFQRLRRDGAVHVELIQILLVGKDDMIGENEKEKNRKERYDGAGKEKYFFDGVYLLSKSAMMLCNALV